MYRTFPHSKFEVYISLAQGEGQRQKDIYNKIMQAEEMAVVDWKL